MQNLNKPADRVLTDLINETNAIYGNFVPFQYDVLTFQNVTALTGQDRNTSIEVIDIEEPSETDWLTLNYNRVSLTTATHYKAPILAHDGDWESVHDALDAINERFGLQLTTDDVEDDDMPSVEAYPVNLLIRAKSGSLIYIGSTTLQLVDPEAGDQILTEPDTSFNTTMHGGFDSGSRFNTLGLSNTKFVVSENSEIEVGLAVALLASNGNVQSSVTPVEDVYSFLVAGDSRYGLAFNVFLKNSVNAETLHDLYNLRLVIESTGGSTQFFDMNLYYEGGTYHLRSQDHLIDLTVANNGIYVGTKNDGEFLQGVINFADYPGVFAGYSKNDVNSPYGTWHAFIVATRKSGEAAEVGHRITVQTEVVAEEPSEGDVTQLSRAIITNAVVGQTIEWDPADFEEAPPEGVEIVYELYSIGIDKSPTFLASTANPPEDGTLDNYIVDVSDEYLVISYYATGAEPNTPWETFSDESQVYEVGNDNVGYAWSVPEIAQPPVVIPTTYVGGQVYVDPGVIPGSSGNPAFTEMFWMTGTGPEKTYWSPNESDAILSGYTIHDGNTTVDDPGIITAVVTYSVWGGWAGWYLRTEPFNVTNTEATEYDLQPYVGGPEITDIVPEMGKETYSASVALSEGDWGAIDVDRYVNIFYATNGGNPRIRGVETIDSSPYGGLNDEFFACVFAVDTSGVYYGPQRSEPFNNAPSLTMSDGLAISDGSVGIGDTVTITQTPSYENNNGTLVVERTLIIKDDEDNVLGTKPLALEDTTFTITVDMYPQYFKVHETAHDDVDSVEDYSGTRGPVTYDGDFIAVSSSGGSGGSLMREPDWISGGSNLIADTIAAGGYVLVSSFGSEETPVRLDYQATGYGADTNGSFECLYGNERPVSVEEAAIVEVTAVFKDSSDEYIGTARGYLRFADGY